MSSPSGSMLSAREVIALPASFSSMLSAPSRTMGADGASSTLRTVSNTSVVPVRPPLSVTVTVRFRDSSVSKSKLWSSRSFNHQPPEESCAASKRGSLTDRVKVSSASGSLTVILPSGAPMLFSSTVEAAITPSGVIPLATETDGFSFTSLTEMVTSTLSDKPPSSVTLKVSATDSYCSKSMLSPSLSAIHMPPLSSVTVVKRKSLIRTVSVSPASSSLSVMALSTAPAAFSSTSASAAAIEGASFSSSISTVTMVGSDMRPLGSMAVTTIATEPPSSS